MPEREYSPEEIAEMQQSRTESDAELIEDGAKYVPNGDSPRLKVTKEQIEDIKEEHEEGGIESGFNDEPDVSELGDAYIKAAANKRMPEMLRLGLMVRSQEKKLVNWQNKDGVTALMMAAKNGHMPTVLWLTMHGAEESLKDKNGKTALSYAVENGHSSISIMLRPGRPKRHRQ